MTSCNKHEKTCNLHVLSHAVLARLFNVGLLDDNERKFYKIIHNIFRLDKAEFFFQISLTAILHSLMITTEVPAAVSLQY